MKQELIEFIRWFRRQPEHVRDQLGETRVAEMFTADKHLDATDFGKLFNNDPVPQIIQKGDRVVVTEKTINYGHDYDKEKAHKYLKVDQRYTIERVAVSSWESRVWLKEYPHIDFNSVHFCKLTQ